MIQCPKCGSPVITPETTRFCAVCNHPFLTHEPSVTIPVVSPVEIPWEEVERLGLTPSLLSTLRESLFSPADFFGRLAFSQNSFMAWLYAMILGSIGSICTFIWANLLFTPLLAMFPGLDHYSGRSAFSIAGLAATPLIITFKLIFSAVYFQVLLFLTRSRRHGIATTFRVVCYTQGTAILDCVPLIGTIIAPLWSLYLLSIGLSKTHAISMKRSVLIVILPVVLLLGGVSLIALAVFGAGMLFQDSFKDLLNLIRY